MTREQKLALIVGFALVLVVGILISDHLSPASLDEPIESLAFASPLGDLPPAVVIEERPARNESATVETVGHEPEAVVYDDPPAESPQRADPPKDEFKPLEFTQGVKHVADDEVLIPLNTIDRPGAGNADRGISKPAIGPGFNAYVVHKGDTLSKIAAKTLGSSGKWKELADLNRDRVGADGSVREGVTLRLPAGASTPKAPATQPKTDKPTTVSPRTYAVKSGDTLSQIAQRELGTIKRTAEILKLNNIDDADEIYAGLVLKLPAR